MTEIKVEQLGGLAGFGGPHLKSWGTVNLSALTSDDRAAVEALFARGSQQSGSSAAPSGADRFRYRLTRTTAAGTDVVEADEFDVPDAVRRSVMTRLD